MDDAFKKARQAGYAAGYKAGRARRQRDLSQRQRTARENAFWQRALLAALPFAWTDHNWQVDGKTIRSMEERARFAGNIADQALRQAIERGRLW